MNTAGNPIRVMFVVPCFGYGGLEQVILNLARELDRSKFKPYFCSLVRPEPDIFADLAALDLPSHIIEKGEGIRPSLPFRLGRLFRNERIALVNSHDVGATLYAAPAARLAFAGKVVHTDHSQILAKSEHIGVYRFIWRHMVDYSVTVSRDLEDHFISRLRVRPELIETIPNGIDTERFSGGGATEALRAELGIGAAEQVVGSIGRLTRQKGMEILIRAFRIILDRRPDTRLVIVGDGDLKMKLQALALELGISERVVFTGIRKDIPDLLRLFDVFVLASLWEGQPITIIEAMAAGRPIVATDAGGNAEILGGGGFGRIVPKDDPAALAATITGLLADRAGARDLGARARMHAEASLSAKAMARRYETVFESVAGGR